jgi:hypothetical protein
MALAIVTLATLAIATIREMLLRAIPTAAGLATLFTLVRTDAGPALTFGAALLTWAAASVAQETLLTWPLRAVRLGAGIICAMATVWVAAQLVAVVA